MTGDLYVFNEKNLLPENIVEGVRIFSVTGTAPVASTPNFTYTGNAVINDEGNDNWNVRFLSGGTFTPLVPMTVGIFAVGGGGGGGSRGSYNNTTRGGGGGGGGYTATATAVKLTVNTPYVVTVGAGGAADKRGGTSSFSDILEAAGGYPGTTNAGGAGGSGGGAPGSGSSGYNGGAGGSNGGDGAAGSRNETLGGKGSGVSTRAFNGTSGTLYAGGGGGGAQVYATGANGGSGGGGNGASGGQ